MAGKVWVTKGKNGGWTYPIQGKIYSYSVAPIEDYNGEKRTAGGNKYVAQVTVFPSEGDDAPEVYNKNFMGYGSPSYEGDFEEGNSMGELRQEMIEEIEDMIKGDTVKR